MTMLRLKRRLRVVDGCPMPEPPAAKPIVYGAAPWTRLPHSPAAHEISTRARAQSILSRGGQRAELPDYETALRIIAAENRPRSNRVTVPPPRADRGAPSLPLRGANTNAAPASVSAAGTHDKRALPDAQYQQWVDFGDACEPPF